MLAKVLSSAVVGIDAYLVDVEVDIAQGLPNFATVGLPEGAVRESKDRVKSAIKNSGYHFPSDRITVNLAPADTRKEGSAFDLPIALGILLATGMLPQGSCADFLFVGELALDGMVRPVKGVLPIAIMAREMGLKGIFLPQSNAPEAAVVAEVAIYAVESVAQVVQALNGIGALEVFVADAPSLPETLPPEIDFADVRGQESAKRALQIAAAGGHNLLMAGPPGAGKTMLAKRLPTILPPLSFTEALETSKVYSVLGLMPKGQGLVATRPFRSPHHTISDAGLIGGGQHPKPGEVSLGHNGVLFLDELPEFRKNVLEVLRQPMEDGCVTIARASASVTYPASFMLVAAMNPCPCGFWGDPKRECNCSLLQIQRYRSKISGPLMDRIDMHLEVPAVAYKDMAGSTPGAGSAEMRAAVLEARAVQARRFGEARVYTNARMTSRQVRHFCRLEPEADALVEKAVERFGLSARAFVRILKIARTIADLDESPAIRLPHVAEAVQYRALDRKLLPAR